MWMRWGRCSYCKTQHRFSHESRWLNAQPCYLMVGKYNNWYGKRESGGITHANTSPEKESRKRWTRPMPCISYTALSGSAERHITRKRKRRSQDVKNDITKSTERKSTGGIALVYVKYEHTITHPGRELTKVVKLGMLNNNVGLWCNKLIHGICTYTYVPSVAMYWVHLCTFNLPYFPAVKCRWQVCWAAVSCPWCQTWERVE